MNKTIRLTVPDWQAGNNPLYYLGSQLLTALVPNNPNQKFFTVPITAPNEDNTNLTRENGVTAQSIVKKNLQETMKILNNEQPDKVITLGGNCLVSQAPFDYLHNKYQGHVGILWIDAHPDISTPKIFPNEHAMVLGNLIHQGDKELEKLVEHPFSPKEIMYVGLQKPTADENKILPDLGINYQTQKKIDFDKIQTWINENNFTKVLIHLDLDALDPKLFHEQYFDQPGVTSYNVSHGALNPNEIMKLLNDLSDKTVGLTIAEYLPWSALQLKEIMQSSKIFD